MADYYSAVPPIALLDTRSLDLFGPTIEQIKEVVGPYFDAEFYRRKYQAGSRSDADLLEEFCGCGGDCLRDPAEWFSSRHYAWVHADVRESGVLPILHFLIHGHREGRSIFPALRDATDDAFLDDPDPNRRDMVLIQAQFDEDFYRSTYPDMAGPHAYPLEHYCVFGWREGRDPNDWFSTQLYLRENPDVAEARGNPFVHYILYGQAEDRSACPIREHQGIRLRADRSASWIDNADLRALIAPTPKPPSIVHAPFRSDQLQLHWVVPDFSVGSGGHMTIFRTIRHLEFAGHTCSIWIFNPRQHDTAEEYYDDIVKHFQPVKAAVRFCDEALWSATGDGIVATGWQTASYVARASGFKERFYFVQDHEPSFYATGSMSLAAELSYGEDLACICASPWLAQLMSERYGRWARTFWLAYERGEYFPPAQPRKDDPERPLRIALYGRSSTARRCVELAILALEHLTACGETFEVHVFGREIETEPSSFPAVMHGVMNAQDLGELYRSCDIGICFSATNYSLVPQEMMACGLPVVELDVPSTRVIFPAGVVTLAGPHPLRIAEAIKGLLDDPDRRESQRDEALCWVERFSWAGAAEMVTGAVLERLRERGHSEQKSSVPKTIGRSRGRLAMVEKRRPKASVCIPTFNGGATLHQVIDRVRAQSTPWPYEIVLIDSTSSDGSIERYLDCTDIRVKQIAQSSFGHGRTRNACVEMADGDFCAFLTQDAVPTDENWLYNMITCLEHFPDAAGAFGRHIAWPSASPFVKHEISEHFRGFLRLPIALSRHTDAERWSSGDQGWRQVLHFFSDNNSCLRRSAWIKFPYPDCEYGEDQLWADEIIKAGFQKVYVPSATVIHSHDYQPNETRARAKTEAMFFRECFGYTVYDDTIALEEQIRRINRADQRWARINGVDDANVAARMADNAARLEGYRDGVAEVRCRSEQKQVCFERTTLPPVASANDQVTLTGGYEVQDSILEKSLERSGMSNLVSDDFSDWSLERLQVSA